MSIPIRITVPTDITQLPRDEYIQTRKTGTYVIGDLHGNALKFFHILCVLGIISPTPEDYQKFVDLYYKPFEKQRKRDYKWLYAFIEKIHHTCSEWITNTQRLVFVGDDMGDRGSNDWFTLNLYRLLRYYLQTSYKICVSNHNFEFIRAYETFCFRPYIIDATQARSLLILKGLIDRKFISQKDVDIYATRYYTPHLVLYETIPVNGGTVFITHAPVGMEVIKNLHKKYNQNYYLNHEYEVKGKWVIDYNEYCYNLHRYMQKFYFRPGQFHTLVGPDAAISGFIGFKITPDGNPIERLMWNRNMMDINHPKRANGEKIFWIHGHDSRAGDPKWTHVINLDYDNYLGKSDRDVTGNLNFAWIPPCTEDRF